MKLRNTLGLGILAVAGILAGCAASQPAASSDRSASAAAPQPVAMRPFGQQEFTLSSSEPAADLPEPDDLTKAGAVAWGTAPAEIIDTTTHSQATMPPNPAERRVKEVLPAHHNPWTLPTAIDNDLPVGTTLSDPRAHAGKAFPAITSTGWTPPDPTHAVGPTHIVSTVNMSLAFYAKDGTLEYYNDLSDAGNPGFFEPLGAGGFTFDPKCFYDHYAQRFVVLALETYGTTEAWITFAVSDDSNPNGTWYKYRTNAVINVGGTTYWWDYPGFGYDEDAYYVTGNLFGLSSSGWAGVGFRVFNKADVLVGDPVVYSTLRDGNASSVQVAQHFGSNIAPYFVSTSSTASLRVHAIRNPITSPSLVSTTVTVPSFSGPFDAPAAGGNTVALIDNRIMNVHWRDGNLYACHNISSNGRNFARWYHMQTNNWPTSGSVTLVQSGNIDGGTGVHTWFPAIYSNANGEVGLVCGSSSSSQKIRVNVTGRTPADPLGTMGSLVQVIEAPVNGGGRWGDYYDIAIDPTDDTTFWAIGEIPTSGGWSNEISDFTINDLDAPVAVPDNIGTILAGNSITVDVMVNDYHTNGGTFDIATFDATSTAGGMVTLSSGTGPGGRDELIYQTPTGYNGPDSFEYTIEDTVGAQSTAAVTANVYDPHEATPAVVVVRTGTLTGGDVAEIDSSDNTYVTIASQTVDGKERTKSVYRFDNTLTTVSSLKVTFETAATVSGGNTHFYLWNYDTKLWDKLDNIDQPTADTVSVYNVSNPNAYVKDTSGRIQVKIFMKTNGTPFVTRVDHIDVTVTP